MRKKKLKPCPACGSKAIDRSSYSQCSNTKCRLSGPDDDSKGTKWNAMLRLRDLDEMSNSLRMSREDAISLLGKIDDVVASASRPPCDCGGPFTAGDHLGGCASGTTAVVSWAKMQALYLAIKWMQPWRT